MLANRLLEGNKDVYYIYQISTDSFPFNSFDKLSESEQKPQLGLLFLDKLKKQMVIYVYVYHSATTG